MTVFALIVMTGAAASYVINPYGHFTTTVFPPRVGRDRDQKLALWRKLEVRPRLVVVGSSHVKKLDPACITKLTGLPAFNFGVDGGSLDDVQAVFRVLVESESPPSQILLGVDPSLLASVHGVARQSMWSRDLSKYIDTTLDERVNAIGEMLWSQGVLADDFAVVRRGRGGGGTTTHALRADGFFETPDEDAERRRGTYDLEAKLADSVGRLVSILGTANVDPRRSEKLRTLLVDAKRRGIEVVAFVPPMHPALLRALSAQPGFVATSAQIAATLGQLEREGLLHYHATELAEFGGDPADFLDADHMNERNASKLLGRIYGHEGACAVQ